MSLIVVIIFRQKREVRKRARLLLQDLPKVTCPRCKAMRTMCHYSANQHKGPIFILCITCVLIMVLQNQEHFCNPHKKYYKTNSTDILKVKVKI